MTTVTDGRSSEVNFGEMVAANYFSVLGVTPQLGRDSIGRRRARCAE